MDPITLSFLDEQFVEAEDLLDGCDLVRIARPAGPELVLAEFTCRGLVREQSGEIVEAEHFVVGFHFASDYLRRVRVPELLTVISPQSAWHPNMGGSRAPTAICIGEVKPSTPLINLLHRVYEVITWQAFTPVEYEALNYEACAWARANPHRLPVDARPLRWRANAAATIEAAATTAPTSLLDAMEIVE